MVSELLGYAHNQGDTVVMRRCLVQALRNLRGQRSEWGAGRIDFVLEPGVVDYPFGAYPRLPGGIMALSSDVLVASSSTEGAVLEPSVLVSSTNLTGDITDLQDSAQEPDDDDLRPSSSANTDFVVRWDQALTRALIPGLLEGQGAQNMRLSMFNQGTDRVVGWEVKEGAVSVATGSVTVTSSNRRVYEVRWDAAVLSTLNPAAGQITLTVTDATGTGEVSFSAVQWFTRTRDEVLSLTSGQYKAIDVHISDTLLLLGGRKEVVRGFPERVSVFNNAFQFYPTPNGAFLCTFAYQKDATRDETTNAKIDVDSTTETNEWFRDGFNALKNETLIEYYATRSHDPKAMQLVQLVQQGNQHRNDLAYEMGIHQRAPRGQL